MTVPTWVVGSGGLLGRALVRELDRRGDHVITSTVPWSSHKDARAVLARDAASVLALADGGPWRLAWCAGSGVTGTSETHLLEEIAALRTALESLVDGATTGTVLLASSAGGVFAGSAGAPHDETTVPVPLSAYGSNKLVAEQVVTDWATEHLGRAVIARYSNLYGPGQNLRKPQGLVSHLCRGFLTATPISIYVPIDTMRDYLYVDDAAALTADLLGLDPTPGRPVLKICAAGQAVTVGALIGHCTAVFGRRPRVVMGSSPLTSMQAVDLRLRSVVETELDARVLTPMAPGIAATLAATRIQLFS